MTTGYISTISDLKSNRTAPVSLLLKIAVFLLALIDVFPVRLFVYQSLSLYFTFTLASAVMLMVVTGYIFVCGDNKIIRTTEFSVFACLVLLWSAYVVIHTFAGNGEHYRMYLYAGYTCWFWAVLLSIRYKLLSRNTIIGIFYIFGIIESFICILQALGMVKSVNGFFAVTGTYENPNITAMFLMACLPFGIFAFHKKQKIIKIVCAPVLLTAVVLLQCRTAYIGVGLIFMIFLFQQEKVKNVLKRHKIIILPILLLVLVSSFFLYHFKKDSADGRLLIWKISAQMIERKPIFGYGYGLFERNYNLVQADYFASGKGNAVEKQNADHVNMAYNEYIEQTVEGGIFGLLFYAGFIVFGLYFSIRKKDLEATTVILMVFVAGFFNFIIQCLPLCMLLFCYCASLLPATKYHIKVPIRKMAVFLFIFSCLFLVNQSKLMLTQRYLKRAIILVKNGQLSQALQVLEKNESRAETSEAFLRNYGQVLLLNKNYSKGTLILKKAVMYSSGIDIYFLLSECYREQQKYIEAEKALQTVMQMSPSNLKSRYRLMILYYFLNEPGKARQMAQEIINIQPKRKTKEGEFYKREAQKQHFQLIKKITYK
jgi:O-antigen ligase